MTKIIHMPSFSSQPYMTTACGVEAYVWRQPDDPPGTCSADPQGGEVGSILFVVGEEYKLVDCPACRPAAILAQERHQKFLREVEEAGGLEEFQRKSREWVLSIAAARRQRPQFEFPEITTESDFERDVLPEMRKVARVIALEEFVIFSNPKNQRLDLNYTLEGKYPEVAANCAVSECRRAIYPEVWEEWGEKIELVAREVAEQTAKRALKIAGISERSHE